MHLSHSCFRTLERYTHAEGLHQSVLSTTFFSYDGNLYAISSWWWIVPLTAAPLTGLVMFLWFWWYRQRLSRDHANLQTRRDVVEGGQSDTSLASGG